MGTPTEKQLKYRDSLIREILEKAQVTGSGTPVATLFDPAGARKAPLEDWHLDVRGRRLADLALMLALPEPATGEECSDQIDSLKLGGGLAYGRTHRDWAGAVNQRFTAALAGKDAPAVMRVSEIRAIATGL